MYFYLWNQWQILPEKSLVRKLELLFTFYTISYLRLHDKPILTSYFSIFGIQWQLLPEKPPVKKFHFDTLYGSSRRRLSPPTSHTTGHAVPHPAVQLT